MEYIVQNIAFNLKKIRKAKKMSLDDTAEQTGVSKSMLGQIERGESNPTVGVLNKIVSGLRVEFNDLIEEPRVPVYTVDYEKLIPAKEVPGQYRVYNYFPFEKKRSFEIYVIEVEAGGAYESGSHGEKTVEYITVMEGTITIEINEQQYEVRSKDSIRFDSDRKHVYRNRGDKKVSLLSCFAFEPKM